MSIPSTRCWWGGGQNGTQNLLQGLWETSIFQKKCRNPGRDNLHTFPTCLDALRAPVMEHKPRLDLTLTGAFIAEFSLTLWNQVEWFMEKQPVKCSEPPDLHERFLGEGGRLASLLIPTFPVSRL